ncbi:MAG: hypothetical protein DI598_09090 [Pseudopedobacter saltans]|uniref:Outer membrane insertion C-signal n=1 Tax=Pseudopedobacter saltans TaxID=151895 RepID=A0A2W5F2B3_9SPHI|nr:MAG: hypothetical protein DI598_09090 [Pseudopedobacter saltans]
MKKKLFSFAIAAITFLAFNTHASAQRGSSYDNGLGLWIDAGNGGTFVGPHLKHYFNSNDAGQINLLFGNSATILGAEYTYNKAIDGAPGLKWNIGVGPQLQFAKHFTGVAIRPIAGLEYKVSGAPIAINFDWRPWWQLNHGSDFEAGRFGIGFKYTF